MKGQILRRELFRQMLRPLTYISAAVFIITVNLLFFITSGFFIQGQGTSEIRTLFSLIPYLSILVIPALTMDFRSSREEAESMLPVSNLKLSVLKWGAAFIMYIFMLILLLPSIIIVSCFGDINVPQVISCYTGIILYAAAAISLSCFLAEFFSSRISAFFVSAGFIFIFTVSDLIPLAVSLPSSVTDFLNQISFSWHFDSFSKGILDTSDIFFYVILTALFIILSAEHAEYCKKVQKPYVILLWCLASLILLVDTSLYSTRFDITADRQFSVSEASSETLDELASPLEMTYYLSDELERMYPQIKDVKAFLFSYARENPRIKLTITNPAGTDAESRLSELGIQSEQLQTSDASTTSFITVYSSILLEYEGSAAVIPFVLSTATLEFDLTSRVKTLITGSRTVVYIITGNGLSLDAEYMYVAPWLESAGFVVQETTPEELQDIDNTSGNDVLLVLGSSELSSSAAASIENWIMKGYGTFIATAPYTADISHYWTVSPAEHDYLSGMLDYWGVCPEQAITLDLSNYRIRMYTGTDMEHWSYLNYPFWIVCLPQYANPGHPVTESFASFETYWASPLSIYQDESPSSPVITPLLLSSPAAWLQKPDVSRETPYVTDPLVSENLTPDEATKGQYILAASVEGTLNGWYTAGKSSPVRLIVSGDQYFPSTMIEYTNSTGNLDFLINSLLWLSRKDSMLPLKNKGMMNVSLYKITDSGAFEHAANLSKAVLFAAMPLLLLIIAVLFIALRKKRTERHIKALFSEEMGDKHK